MEAFRIFAWFLFAVMVLFIVLSVYKILRLKKKPKEKAGLTYSEKRNEVYHTNVTNKSIYTQDWDREETEEDRRIRLEKVMLKKASRVQK